MVSLIIAGVVVVVIVLAVVVGVLRRTRSTRGLTRDERAARLSGEHLRNDDSEASRAETAARNAAGSARAQAQNNQF
ncbi:hypothetical protein AX769_04865 [Frondihabitans sp. PAMC 28766]|uniref:hypothetical protein n=1 Tax=Frondihabitans sp. PAMC 28766 TaxID=1795630 RepID=UPI00078D63F9|nr:hypothetical protein [Frondihabitans sp. PAMC 28766]AMM19593.1 hypothetical protein AX769_04865 [Frondihabitans sp. PAMC 28766]